MKRIIILGATGSIGRQALNIISRHPESFMVAGLSAHHDTDGLLEAADLYGTRQTCLSGSRSNLVRYSGSEGLLTLIRDTDADMVLNAVAGADGLAPSFEAIRSGKDLALANKETIVMAGRLVMEAAQVLGTKIVPVDSEHSAIFSMVERFGVSSLKSVIITASGGAFRDYPLEKLATVTPADALAHPTWNMGAKITVDSASMANKGLEIIEASRLFNLDPDRINVVIHPESRVHSFIRTLDGSLYAQMSRPDMRIPILNAFSWPEYIEESIADMEPTEIAMHFYKPDLKRYPLLGLAFSALADGEGACTAYNAANEVAVEAFMREKIRFPGIYDIVAGTLDTNFQSRLDDIDAVMAVDSMARTMAESIVKEHQ